MSDSADTAKYYAVKKVFVKFFAKFFEVFAKFIKVRKYCEVFASFSRLSDPFGSIGMHWDAFGCTRKQLEVFGRFQFFEFFLIFESFDISGRKFYKRLFSQHNISDRSEKSSNGRNIARIAPILMSFGPIESQRHDLFLKKNSNERNERKVLRLRRRRRRRSFSERYRSAPVVIITVLNS